MESLRALSDLPALGRLYLDGNPCTDAENYRSYAVYAVPQLKVDLQSLITLINVDDQL
jgi:hypothetical protein